MPDAFAIFERLLDLPEAERMPALDEACGGDAEIRREVMALLAADADAAGFLEPEFYENHADAVRSGVLTSSGLTALGVPEEIGPYKVEEQIGEGGFGVVYRALQTSPIERRVALKVIKPGMDSAAVLRRFDAERRALELLDHPNIARVLDAGLVPDGQPGAGRPFFAMELVDGRPITDHVSDASLTIDECLGLALQICDAAQHAHTKAIVHRDLKPANILVTDLDGRPSCKVIDFGIAKALNDTDSLGTQLTALTSPGAMVGTPQYMSPEQARGSADIDTRTDVYAIGVVLYELLAGAPPFDAETLRSTDLEALRKLIETVDPPPPGTRRAESRGDEARLPRELDWITMRALEKDPDRRYPSVAALADDLKRFRRSEPVSAARPSRLYRFSKFVRRNRVGFAAGSVAGAAVLAGAVFSVWFGVRAEAARRAEAAQRVLTERNETRVLAINEFLTRDLFFAANMARLGPEATVPALLAETAPTIDERFAGDDALRAEMHVLMGTMYLQTNQHSKALGHFGTAIGLAEAGVGLFPLTEIDAHLGRATIQSTVGELDSAEADARKAIALVEGGLEGGARWATAAKRTEALQRLAVVLAAKAETGEADLLFAEILPILREVGDTEFLVQTLSNRASNLWHSGRADEAEVLSREMIEIGDADDSRTSKIAALTGRFWLSLHLQRRGEIEEAAEMALGAAEGMSALSLTEDPSYASGLMNAAGLLTEAGRYDEAAPMIDESLDVFASVFGPRHYEVERHSNIAATIHANGGNPDAARPMRTRGLLLRLYTAGPGEAESVLGIMPAAAESFGSETEFLPDIVAELDGLAPEDELASQFAVNAGLALASIRLDDDAERAYLLAYERLGVSEKPERTRATLAERLPAFYRERGRGAEAVEWAERLAEPIRGRGDE